MKKYIPFNKLSKKARRKENERYRKTWGALNPATRKPPNPKAYDRNKEKAALDLRSEGDMTRKDLAGQ
jgi:hypothetical protein